MAFDGITIANVVKELNDTLTGGRLYKIAQPEPDELLLTIKTGGGQYRLLISAGASLPLVYLTEKNKQSPMTAPNFCMLLRKHLQNGRILSITQPGLERILHMDLEHLDEMGDVCRKRLVVEIMGKHSNIIFCNSEGTIIDSIKHISGLVSSVREVLPGKSYFVPETQEKENPLETSEPAFIAALHAKPMPAFKAIYMSYTGLSPVIAQELCYRAGVDGERPASALTLEEYHMLYEKFSEMMERIKAGSFSPSVAYTGKEPVEFAAFPLTIYERGTESLIPYESMSALLEEYYAQRNTHTRIRQRSADLRRIVQTALERNVKKYDLQLTQMRDAQKKDKYRIYGELINTYGYGIEEGSKSFQALNYYTGEMMEVPLQENMTPAENARKYFEKYNKLKRTYETLAELSGEVKAEIEHLESVSTALDIAMAEEDLVQIKEELIASGYIRRKGGNDRNNRGKKEKITSQPFHYVGSEGYHIYVGKNNYQNDELTFKFATGNDWWFHAKGMAGSHVIVKNPGDGPMPDAVFEEAARLAAYYSKGRGQEKVEVDYIQKKQIKKPAGAKPGFVVYHTNYSMMIDTDISAIEQV